MENEIAGVIQGSLTAALKQRHLSGEEYLEEIRSNIPIKTTAGKKKRERVCQEFLHYQRWKKTEEKCDIGDIILQLISLEMNRESSLFCAPDDNAMRLDLEHIGHNLCHLPPIRHSMLSYLC